MTTNITLDGVSLATAVPSAAVLSVARGLTGAPRGELVEVPGRAGSWQFPEEPGDRPIRVTLHLLADDITERRAEVRALAAWVHHTGRVDMVIADEPDRLERVTVKTTPAPTEWLTAADITLEFAAEAYSYAVSTSSEAVTAAGSPDSGTFDIDNLFVDAEPIIEITPLNGNLTSFEKTLNGDTIGWSDALVASGDTITISSLNDTVTIGANVDMELTGFFDPDDVAMQTVTATGFPLLVPGSNAWALTWAGTATNVRIEFTWRERYI